MTQDEALRREEQNPCEGGINIPDTLHDNWLKFYATIAGAPAPVRLNAIFNYFLALQAKELGEVRDRVKRQRYEVDMEKGSEFSTPRDYRARGYNSALDTITSFLDELIEKPTT